MLTAQIQNALQKAGITLHIWTPEQARQAVGPLTAEARHRLDNLYGRQLKAQLGGGLPDGHVYDFGLPDRCWLAAGVTNAPVRMAAGVADAALRQLEGKRRMQALTGLSGDLRHPAAIFRLDEQADRRSVLVCIDRADVPLILRVSFHDSHPAYSGQVTVDAVYPLQALQRRDWLRLLDIPGKALYIDKQQMHALIDTLRRHDDADRSMDYRRLADVVTHFVNPRFEKQVARSLPYFYSNARHALDACRQDKATPAQWLAMLQKAGGIKAGEDRWTGLSQWLKDSSEKTLSKEAVRQYIDGHHIKLGETDYHEPHRTQRFKELQDEFSQKVIQLAERQQVSLGDEAYDLCLDLAFNEMVSKYGDDFSSAFGVYGFELQINNADTAAYYTGINAIHDTRLNYTTPGLDNYHELAFFVEGIESWNEDDEVHFGEVGYLDGGQCIGWVRFGEKTMYRKPTLQERWQLAKEWPGPEAWVKSVDTGMGTVRYTTGDWTMPHQRAVVTQTAAGFSLHNLMTGKSSLHDSLDEAVDEYIQSQIPSKIPQKMLFIDEIQSERHQQGREEGYRDEVSYRQAEDDYAQQAAMMNKFWQDMRQKYGTKPGHPVDMNELTDEERRQSELIRDNFSRAKYLSDKMNAMPPPAPFEKNWHELCMKRMLRYAVDNGFDSIAWTTGVQQGERYQMGTFLKGLKALPMREGIVYDSLSRDRLDGYEVRLELTHGSEIVNVDTAGRIIAFSHKDYDRPLLSDIIGKRLATRVLSSTERLQLASSETSYLMNIEGMRSFYDEMLPSFIRKYGKRWGLQVRETNVPYLGKWHVMDVTAALRKGVMQGQPMFMFDKRGEVLGLALDDHIYLTPEGLNPGTMLHEYTHVWATAMRYGNPEGWQCIKDLLRKSPVWGEIIGHPGYADIRGDDDAVASEVLAHVSGREGTERLENYEVSHSHDVMAGVREAMKRFWSWVGTHLFDLKHFNTLDEVTDRILYDLASGTVLEPGRPLATAPDLDRLSAITVYKGKGGQPHIRCKVDGIQQMGKPLKGLDGIFVMHKENIHSLALAYFRKELESSTGQKSSLHR